MAVGTLRLAHLRRTTSLLATAAVTLTLLALHPGSAHQPSARDAAPVSAATNPLAGPWGHYSGNVDSSLNAYRQASGSTKTLLAKIGPVPKVQWFGSWIPTSRAASTISKYIAQTQNGNPDALVQLAVFRLWPRGEGAKSKPLSSAEQAAYRSWVDAAARGIGSARVAMVLEPDLGVSLKGWKPSVRMALAKYAAYRFSRLPRTTIYLDASDADWLKADQAVSMLRHSGIQYVRGFALGATHYASLSGNITYGKQLVAKLNAAGVRNRHFVVDTADNGRAFTWLYYYAHHPKGRFDNAETCTSRTQLYCITLGKRPTTHVSSPTYVDAYLWFGRPWLNRQAAPFSMSRALAVARTTPY